MVVSRRMLLGTALAAAAVPVWAAEPGPVHEALRALEKKNGGRLGVGVLETSSARFFGYRQNELFPMCSTFKLMAAARVLQRVDRGEERLERRVVYGEKDLVTYSP